MPLGLLRYLCPRSELPKPVIKEVPGKDRFVMVRDPHTLRRNCQWISQRRRRGRKGPDCSRDFAYRALVQSTQWIGDMQIDLEEAFYCTRHLSVMNKRGLINHFEETVHETLDPDEDEGPQQESQEISRSETPLVSLPPQVQPDREPAPEMPDFAKATGPQ